MLSPRILGLFAAASFAVACGPNHESLLDDDSNAFGQGDSPERGTEVSGASSSSGQAPPGSSSGTHGGSSGAGSSSGGGASSSGSSGSSSGAAACATACGDNARCNPATDACSCLAGFHDDGGGNCVQAATGTPASHTEAEVCQHWTAGHQTTASGNGWTAGAAQCDPGTLSRPALDDAVSRINLFRWLEGLAPAVDDEAGHASAMACATVGSWNPPGTVPSPHQPPPSATCYTPLGAQGAGSSNMAWGSGTMAGAMDQWVQDNGNETTLGHRRWLLNPALGRTALGFYAGGGGYGNAACMSSFDGSGTGPSPAWFAFPPEGFAPVQLVGWTWSVHLATGNANAGTLTVVRESDGQTLGFTKLELQAGYGAGSTVGFDPQGWQPSAGETYHATFTSGAQTLTWSVTASGC